MRFIRPLQRLSCAAVVAAGTATLIVPTTAQAAIGCGETALVGAITATNASGGGTVTLAPGCAYVLTASHGAGGNGPDGLPLITTSITIVGSPNTITPRRGGTPVPHRRGHRHR